MSERFHRFRSLPFHLFFLCLASGFLLLASPPASAILDTNENGMSDLWEKSNNGGLLFPETLNQASAELIERNDEKTILRLIYSLKGGNAVAEDILRRHDSLNPLPYLMEDVAHGSIERYEKYPPGGDVAIVGRVRSVATNIVAGTLANSPEITGETRDCLRDISVGSDGSILSVTEKSRYLIRWWLLNESTLDAGKWGDALPLPEEIRYPSADTTFPPMKSGGNQEISDRRTHILGPSWELPESFEEWSKRIVHPELRNLDFVDLSWDGEKVVEHPPKSLDPKKSSAARPDRVSHRSRTRGNPAEQESGEGVLGWIGGHPWLMLVSLVVVVVGLFRLKRKGG